MKKILLNSAICTMLFTTGWAVDSALINKTVTLPVGVAPVASGTAVKIPSEPYIQSFTLKNREGYGNPQAKLDVVKGVPSDVVFNWNVQPGNPPSPITQLRLTRTMGDGPNLNLTPGNFSGNTFLNIPENIALGETIYTLTAINEAGNIKSSTTMLNVVNISSFGSQLTIDHADMDHSAEVSAFDFRFNIQSSSTADVPVTVDISVIAQGSTSPVRISNTMNGKIKYGLSNFVISNCVIPHPTGSVWNNLVISVKLKNGTLVRQFMVPLQNSVVRTYWVPGT